MPCRLLFYYPELDYIWLDYWFVRHEKANIGQIYKYGVLFPSAAPRQGSPHPPPLCVPPQASWLRGVQVKPWQNEVASRPNLRLRLARACVHLPRLAITCAHFGRDQICTQVDASFSPFGHPTQVNASWVTSIDLLLANETEDSLPQNVFFCDLRVLARKLASPFGHPTEVSTQVQLASTCDYLQVRLARALVNCMRRVCIHLSWKRPQEWSKDANYGLCILFRGNGSQLWHCTLSVYIGRARNRWISCLKIHYIFATASKQGVLTKKGDRVIPGAFV